MTAHPIIARLYFDRQRQQTRLQHAQEKLEEAAQSVLSLDPMRQHYGTNADHVAAVKQYNDWLARIKAIITELANTTTEIRDSLSALESHLKGYPK